MGYGKIKSWTIGLSVIILFYACRVPDRYLVGSYKSSKGDSLVLTEDHFFRVESANPDSTIHLYRMSSGRWYRTRTRLYLTMDSRSMGQYWNCAPFRIHLNILNRNDTCAGSNRMVFNKVIIHRKKKGAEGADKKEKKKKKVVSDE
jgi:hypothetical protein